MHQWCDRVNYHLCVGHQFCINCERKTFFYEWLKIVVLNCLYFLLYKDKSPDKKLALQMEVKALVLFVENLSRFVYCFVSKCFHPALLVAFPLSYLLLSKLYLVLLSCWWLPLLTKHVFSAIPVLKTSVLITSKHHRCVYLSSWHPFSMTSSQSCSSDHIGSYKITSVSCKVVLLEKDSESLRCYELLNCSHGFFSIPLKNKWSTV